ncbi:hypothetical protein TWF481_005994 [Arthrobotrys musiformis]|uniref:Inhibitor I9 domain-containing protein n=1 Tax=Arthrobotrys musiformis TaxID=47236 RepID=A0AAV9WHG4_9PEZI
MPTTYIITIKDGVSKEEAKQHVIDSGGKITHDYSIVNAFTAEFPDGVVTTFETHPDVDSWELDGVVTTQPVNQ